MILKEEVIKERSKDKKGNFQKNSKEYSKKNVNKVTVKSTNLHGVNDAWEVLYQKLRTKIKKTLLMGKDFFSESITLPAEGEFRFSNKENRKNFENWLLKILTDEGLDIKKITFRNKKITYMDIRDAKNYSNLVTEKSKEVRGRFDGDSYKVYDNPIPVAPFSTRIGLAVNVKGKLSGSKFSFKKFMKLHSTEIIVYLSFLLIIVLIIIFAKDIGEMFQRFNDWVTNP